MASGNQLTESHPPDVPSLHPTNPTTNPTTWSARDLLNPRGPGLSPEVNRNSVARRPVMNGSTATEPVAFVFAGTNANSTPAQDVKAGQDVPLDSNEATATESLQAYGAMIERMNNVQERSDVPPPKRRKVELDENVQTTKNGFHGGSSGILVGDLKQNGENRGKIPSTARIETVDLTEAGDDDLILLDKSTDNDADAEVCYGMVEGATVNCHKVPAPKPGMKAILGPNFWPQVKVVLRRKSADPNSVIHVYDYTREVFGTVDAKTATALTPLLDSSLRVRTDCRIASRKKQPDEVLGQPISRATKFELMLYGPRKYGLHIGKWLASKQLKLLSPPRVETGVKVFNPHAKEFKGPPLTRLPADSNGVAQPPAPPPMIRTVEEIRSEVMGVFDSLTKSEDLPEMEPDACIQTELLKHQKQALYFMTNREKPRSGPDDTMINSCWQRRTVNGQPLWYNVVTGHAERRPPPDTLGGILADMMGLGKTLCILSLITQTRAEAEKWTLLAPVQPRAPVKKPSHPSKHFNVPQPEGFGLTPLKRNGKTTLLICPLSTITNWEEQIKQHIQPNAFKYHIYHGQNRKKDLQELLEHDLVITTYGSVSSELTSRTKRKSGPFPLEEIGWFRIVLDEAHMIREQSTLQFKAVCRLQASCRWAVTGTPVQNRLDDLAALLAFLRMKPFDDRGKFIQYIVTPFKNCDPEIVPKLRVLVDSITLRRLKDKIDLPPRTDHIVKLDFSPEERRLYDLFSQNAQERVQILTGQGGERILGGKTYIHILQSILRLRLICAHGKELLNPEDLDVLQGMTADAPIDLDSDDEDDKPALAENKAYEMFELIKETNNDVCVACARRLGANDAEDIESERQEDVIGYMTPCFHIYCPSCIKSFRDEAAGIAHNSNAYGSCPVCAHRVKFSCVELRHTRADVEHESHLKAKSTKGGGKTIEGYGGPHTKTRALLEDLLKSKAESESKPDEPPIKSVIFSGWTSHLDLIQLALENHGISYTRLDGKMTRTARTQAMDTFRDDPSVHVILVSIMAGGLGLNLTTANNVYVMEPQYNPAAEAQAIDRVHRLGQKRAVRNVRYIIRDSFEEKMLELQEKKKKLASLSMDNRDNRILRDRSEAARQRLTDLRSLFK